MPPVTRLLGAATSASIWAATVRSAVPSEVLALTLTTKTVTVVDQNVAQIAGQRWCGIALAVQPRFRVALGFGRGVAAQLTKPVLGRTAIVRTVFASLALVAGSGMVQRVV